MHGSAFSSYAVISSPTGLDSDRRADILVSSMKIYTTELIRRLAHRHGRTQDHYRQALAEIIGGIAEALAAGDTVQLTGFGTFYTRQRPESTVKDLRTGGRLDIAPRCVAAFRVGWLLKRAVLQKRPVGRPRLGVGALFARAGQRLIRPTHKTRSMPR